LICYLTLSGTLSMRAGDFEPCYWVWQRDAPLRVDERAELKSQNVRKLFWHIGEIDFAGGDWRWRNKPLSLGAPAASFDGEIVPVIRLVAPGAVVFEDPELERLLSLIDGFLSVQSR